MDNQEVIDGVEETTIPTPEATTGSNSPAFTADDLAKARAQEKAKLYPQIEKMASELELLKKEREEEAARKAAKKAEREAEEAAKAKEKEEKELSYKELLKKKEQEFQSALEAERLERENAFALLEKERKFQEIMMYRQQRIEEERENIVPQLIDLISGNTPDEIEQSIATLRAKSDAIMQDVQQATLSAKQQMVGARVTAPASGPLDNETDQQIVTPDSIRDMSLADYAKQRAKLLGGAANNRGQGLFG